MASEMILHALSVTERYLSQHYSDEECGIIQNEIETLTGAGCPFGRSMDAYSYEEVQTFLSGLNEKESIRKKKGVYYTPTDIVRFILINSAKLACGKLKPDNIHVTEPADIPYRIFCYEKSIFDPTCGTGVFLLSALEMKLDLLDLHHAEVSREQIQKAVASIRGNDVNGDSILITKIRLFLSVLHRYGVKKVTGLAKIMNPCFFSYDFVTTVPDGKVQYDIIIGNPPYVEDSKSESVPQKKYGNIYANVLEHAALHLKPGGVLGFVIPLSYVSTPRMRKIRDTLYRYIPEQYVLSYSDRPDCLFAGVHQKLCVLFGKNGDSKTAGCQKTATERKTSVHQTTDKTAIYTANYKYWYKEERQQLFNAAGVVKNAYVTDDYIPKLGTKQDVSIYQKLVSEQNSLMELFQDEGTPVYVNMRAAFWMKVFLREHSGAEYKVFRCRNEEYAGFCMCLLNSSLFWWYWICVSDCWHITRKELQGFRVPDIADFTEVNRLARALEERLEETKVYVGTKQTAYEYKHKECAVQIHQIDDYIHGLYGLTEEEGRYIKEFAYRYRVGGGVGDGCH